MQIHSTSLPDVLIIEPTVYDDERGSFYESFNARRFEELTGVDTAFVQDNHSSSFRHVLRGLHYQVKHPQGKLVRVVSGEVLDVVVDLRQQSPTYGNWLGTRLSANNQRQLWVPPGFAHGFVVLSASAEFLYKTTEYWMAEHERCIIWNDPKLAIDWQIPGLPILSKKDAAGSTFANAEKFD